MNKYPPERRAEAIRRVQAGESQVAVGLAMGIPETTIAHWRHEDGLTKPHANPTPRGTLDPEARKRAVLELHSQGAGTREIARKLGLHSTVVSKVKTELGVAAGCEAVKFSADIDRVTASLEGWAFGVAHLIERIEATTSSFDEREIKRCVKSLYGSARTVSRLRTALRRKLPPKP